MADSSPIFILGEVLEKLSFKQFYPEKLTREDLYQITPESLNTGQKKSSLAWQFVYDITRYNYHARNIKISGTEHVEPFKMGFRERTRLKREATNANIHPLDVLVAVFLCCDPTAKQDLIMHLWGCKLAMPFSLQLSATVKPTVFLWPFRSLIGQFQKYDSYTERQMIHEPMKCIAFIRAGENEQFSKSSLLNCLIGGSEKPHPMFFHRNSEGSKRSRSSATNGLVELGWFLPSENKDRRFNEPKLFVNLRGNAIALNKQIDLIGTMATVTVFLCTVQDLNDIKMTVKRLLSLGSRVILLISDQNPDNDVIDNYIRTSFENEPESHFDIVTAERAMLSDMLDMLLHNINRIEHGGKEVVLSDIVKNLSNMKFCVDESNIDFATAFEYSKDMIDAIKCVDEKERKLTILPLQEKFWKTWAQMDRDFWRFDQLDESEKKRYESKEKLEKDMSKVRNRQFQHFANKGISKPMVIFIKALSNFKDFTRKIFLRMLKLELDSLSRIHLKPFYDKYQELVNQTIQATEEERIKINNKLSDLDDMKSKLSFGMEHVVRELGQLYEACESQPDQEIIIQIEKQKISYKKLPLYACLSLLEGYPIEILDGEACSVPILWISSIFKELPDVLRNNKILKPADDIRVHTISVLGIQSSGKSTFLNVLFGLHFAVSAGRCTRGAFMQLVKVQPSEENEIQADFILAIDTEGLKAAELISTESVKHDNELSTFVIGLADTTVINLMGENATYLHENLPIAVHAFLRMNLVGLHPRCTIVHHNVDKRNREKLIQQSRILENVLNNLTKKACELEKIPPRLFHEIIEFSIFHHTDYIPSLYEGEQPMAPVSIGYSKEVDSVRTKLMDYVCCDSKIDNMANFVRHLKTLWNAIKKDRFVFEFRTTLEAEARLDLDKGYFRILMEYFKQVDEISTRLIARLKSKQYTQKNVADRFSKDEAVVKNKAMAELKKFLEKPKKITSPYFDHWKQKCLENLQSETEKVRVSTKEIFQYVSTQSFPSIPAKSIEDFIDMMSNYQRLFKDFEICFSKVWREWVKTLNFPSPEKSILPDITEALQAVCPAYKHLLSEKKVKASSLSNIRPDEQAHLNHAFHKFSSSRVAELLSKMMAIQSQISNEYSQEISAFFIKLMPYSNIVPKQILLKIGKRLHEELDSYDTKKEISQMFSIDLLLCTSGTMVNDLQCHMEKHSVLRSVEKELRVLAKKQEEKKVTDILFEMIFSTIERMVKVNFYRISQRCLLNALETSNLKVAFHSKQGLLGYCLYHAINTDNDELLSLYFHSPENATTKCLSSILITLANDTGFKEIIKKYLREKTLNMFEYILCSLKEDNVSFHDVFQRFSKHVYIDLSIIDLFKQKAKGYLEITVNIGRLKDEMKGKCEQFLDATTADLASEISTNSMNVISMIANKFSGKVIGCQALCPFCKEICKFSSCHPGHHECFIHRPVGCRGMHWKGTRELSYETCTLHCRKGNLFNYKDRYVSFRDLNSVYPNWKVRMTLNEEPSCVWKWIFVNKHHILRSSGLYELPKNMPFEWHFIHKKTVLRNIRLQFEI
ncbi:interferon-induced very large GTPase 1-like [Ruditapes philippinarum]|uniref:interferon-induced very large GTPase 1-like n=1 Tax=Ruditapes philippinarum TaxID=129788 RepID=UPI00295C38BF|nr:interferon-induced very large GTPase 1-like [Ruditapes philippinarum]